MSFVSVLLIFFFFNDTATTEIYTLSLHDALPIYSRPMRGLACIAILCASPAFAADSPESAPDVHRSEEHTSELQSLAYLVCRLLLEKKKLLSRSVRARVPDCVPFRATSTGHLPAS